MVQTQEQWIRVFDALIKRHEVLVLGIQLNPTEWAQLKSLLNTFAEISQKLHETEQEAIPEDKLRFKHVLDKYQLARDTWTKNQEAIAEDFNFLDVINLTMDEVRHSMLLAWLLDHRLYEYGTHAQRSLGFRLFLEEFGLPVAWAQTEYSVFREESGESSRIDVRILARGSFIIDIENKIGADEGYKQTFREWDDLQAKAKELNIANANVHAFFLTTDGRAPTNKNFQPVKWERIACILEKFAQHAQPEEVKLFARHYAKALKRFAMVQKPTEKIEYDKDI